MLAFVYGTLTDPDRADELLEEWAFEGPATLRGLRRVEGRYPTLVPPAGGEAPATVEGRLLWTPEVDALDDYEGVDRGLYVRVPVPVRGSGEAAVYVGDPARLGAPGEWPGDGPLGARVRRVLAERAVEIVPG